MTFSLFSWWGAGGAISHPLHSPIASCPFSKPKNCPPTCSNSCFISECLHWGVGRGRHNQCYFSIPPSGAHRARWCWGWNTMQSLCTSPLSSLRYTPTNHPSFSSQYLIPFLCLVCASEFAPASFPSLSVCTIKTLLQLVMAPSDPVYLLP